MFHTASETTPFNLYGRRKAMSLYAQDSYKVTSKLTLSLGLRWDATFRFHEKYGHWANFNLTATDPTLGIPGTLQFANGGSDSFEKNEDWKNFGPRNRNRVCAVAEVGLPRFVRYHIRPYRHAVLPWRSIRFRSWIPGHQ